MGLAEIAPLTPSGALLVDQVIRAASCKRWQSLAAPYPRFTSSVFGPAPTGRQPGWKVDRYVVLPETLLIGRENTTGGYIEKKYLGHQGRNFYNPRVYVIPLLVWVVSREADVSIIVIPKLS